MLKSRLHLIILLGLLGLTSITSQAAADLEGRIESALANAGLGRTQVSVSVRDPATGDELVEIHDDRPMIPASNMKLFTSGAALHRFRDEFKTKTSFKLDGRNLWVVGGGDPALGDPEILKDTAWNLGDRDHDQLDPDLFLELIAKSIGDTGVTHLEELIIDDRIFDRDYLHPDWPRDQLDKAYCAEVAGVNMHTNVIGIHVDKGTGSVPVIRSIEPAVPWMSPQMKATRRLDKPSAIGVSRGSGQNDLTIWGNISGRCYAKTTLSDMPTVFGRMLESRLEAEGIRVDSVRLASETDPSPSGRTIDPVLVTHIDTLLTRCNTDSQNLYAEAMCKLLGHSVEGEPGSWENGTRVMRMILRERIGARHAQNFTARDGSGMSRGNRITAEMTTDWIASFERDGQLGPTFLESLAVMGESGTVRKRGSKVPDEVLVQCKTGYINKVSCLSGLVTSPDGRSLAFSVLCNELDPATTVSKAKQFQDTVVALVARQLMRTKTPAGSN